MHDFSTIRLVENSEHLPWSLYVGVLGMPGERCLMLSYAPKALFTKVPPGQTAYYGWSEFARPKKE